MSLLPWGGFGGFGGLNPYSSSDFGLSDPFFSSGWGPMDVFPSRSFAPTFRRMENELGRLLSSVKEDDKTFQVMVDVSQFRPEEVSVKTTDKDIVIHGKHEERSDQNGHISREFRRRVMIPQGVNPESVTCQMTPEGVLTVQAPKLMLESGAKERTIPISIAPASGRKPLQQQQQQQQQQQPQQTQQQSTENK